MAKNMYHVMTEDCEDFIVLATSKKKAVEKMAAVLCLGTMFDAESYDVEKLVDVVCVTSKGIQIS